MHNSISATRPVNPPSATPKLTHAQLWKSMQLKAYDPTRFVTMFKSVEIVDDRKTNIVRRCTTQDGREIVEEVALYEPTSVYFEPPAGIKGSRVLNVISYNEHGDMLLTYAFANGIPGGANSDDIVELSKSIGKIVEHGIQVTRDLVREGVIN